jgi:hypothetical protein
MTVTSLPFGTALTRTLCVIVLVVIIAAVLYAGWIGVTNFGRIHV